MTDPVLSTNSFAVGQDPESWLIVFVWIDLDTINTLRLFIIGDMLLSVSVPKWFRQ